jgi:hypothetical protein
MGGAQSDLAVGYYAFAAFAVLRLNGANAGPGPYRLAGVLAGFGVAMRLNSLPFIAAIAVLQLATARPRLTLLGQAAGCFLLAAAPWFIIRAVQTGNPVFPLYNNIFRSDLGPPENPTYNFDLFGFGKGLRQAVGLPFDVTFDSAQFAEAVPAGALGVAVLLSLAAPLAAPSRLRRIALWVFPALCGTVAWFFVAQYLRYLLPALPFIAALAGVTMAGALARLPRPGADFATAAALGLACAATAPLAFATLWKIPERIPADYVFGTESSDAFLTRILPGYPVARHLARTDERVPGTGNRLLMLTGGLFPATYAGRPGTEGWDYTVQPALQAQDAERVNALRRLGYRWVAIHGHIGSVRNYLREGGLDPESWGPLVAPVFARNGFALYELRGTAAESPPVAVPVCDGGFESPPACWQTFGSPSLVPSATGGGQAARISPGSGYFQVIRSCPGAVHHFTFEARPTGAPSTLIVTLEWLVAGRTAVREDVALPISASEPTRRGLLSSAPEGVAEVRLLFAAVSAPIEIDSLGVTAVGGC